MDSLYLRLYSCHSPCLSNIYPGLVYYDFVHVAPAIGEIAQAFMGTLEQNQKAFFQFAPTEEGLTLKLDVQIGFIVLFASSKIQNPNEAFYDWRLETSSSACVYISQDDLDETSINVYISIEGQSGINNFTLNTMYGDTTSAQPTTATSAQPTTATSAQPTTATSAQPTTARLEV